MAIEWKLVPMHPTEEMIQATLDTGLYHDGEEAARAVLIDEYKAMVKAAPPAPQAASEPVTDHVSLPRKALYRDVMQAKKQLDEFGFRASYLDWITNYATLPNGLTEEETRATASVAVLSGGAEREALTDEQIDAFVPGAAIQDSFSLPQVRQAIRAALTKAETSATASASVGDAEREAFEAWGCDTFNYGFEPETWGERDPGEYAHEGTQMAFEGWRGRAALHSTGKPQAIPSPAERTEPGRRNPLLAYVDSYREMARMGDGRVSCSAVALDIEQNMAPLLEPPAQSTQCAATADATVAEPVAWVDPAMLPYGDYFMAHGNHPRYTKPLWDHPPAPEEAKDAARLDALSRPGWELGMSDDLEVAPWQLWQVHLCSGGRNDREWTLLGAGATPREAIDAAMAHPGEKRHDL